MTSDYSPLGAGPRDRTAPPGSSRQDLVDAIAHEASRDAEDVALFLRELGFVPAADRPVRLPPSFLLQLGAALRLLVWESKGLRVHLDSGLPMAEKAIIDGFKWLEAPTEAKTRHTVELPHSVVALFASRFAWHGRRDLDADVVLDDRVDEDALVDTLAELLWEARHAVSNESSPRKGIGNG